MKTTILANACLVAALFGVVSAACADRASTADGGAATEDAPEFPKLASYDHSCTTDGDCALVPGEGCASCAQGALEARAAASYMMAVAAASRSSACQATIGVASPCSIVAASARCSASVCVVRYPVADAGGDGAAAADADAGATSLDASSD